MLKRSKTSVSWKRTYPQAGIAWVLEKWLSAYEFTGMTAEQWNKTDIGVLGPYPFRGEYELAHIFYPMPMSLGHIERIISLIDAGKRHSANQNKVAMREGLEKEEADKRKTTHDRLMNCFPAFGSAPMAGYGGARGSKTLPEFARTANELGLPTSAGHARTQRGKTQYDVSELIKT